MRAAALLGMLGLMALMAGTALAQAPAQPQPPVLAEGQVTEAALLEALDRPVTRQFKAGVRPRPAQASLLITFVTGSAELTDGARGTLDVLAAAMKNQRLAARSFIVEGHADRRGTAELNRKLSLERARSVSDYLSSRHGIEATRLTPAGKGASEPLNRADPAAPENRRVTIVVKPS
jgi:OmpA-OmpF porin, OOP family